MRQKQSNDEPRETKITGRLRSQVSDLEAAVTTAKQEAVRLFRELEQQARKARSIALSLDDNGGSWARKVSNLMDILGSCRDTMDGMAAIGLLREAVDFDYDLEKVFDGPENDQLPG